jgi:hypothetical protein
VPTPADQLRAFVARTTADEGDPSSQRVRRAMAGESPARFADRLLLERAAHLVATTERPLQVIAADCGFRGYDVFSRAFRRELGALPSQWRADPTSWVIDAPGDVHVHPSGLLRLPARSRVDSVDRVVEMVVEMVEHHVGVVVALLGRARQAPDAELDRLEEGMTLRSALTGCVTRMEAFTALVHDLPATDPPADETLSDLEARLARVGPDFVSSVALLGATGRFDEAFVDAFAAGPTTVSFGTMVTRILTDVDGALLHARIRLRACGSPA